MFYVDYINGIELHACCPAECTSQQIARVVPAVTLSCHSCRSSQQRHHMQVSLLVGCVVYLPVTIDVDGGRPPGRYHVSMWLVDGLT